VRVTRRHRTRAFGGRRSRDFGVCRASLSILGSSGSGFRLRGCRFLGTKRLDTSRFQSRRFGGDSLLLRSEFRCDLRRLRSGSGLLLGGGLHVCRFSPATNGVRGRCHGLGNWLRNRRGSTTTRGWRGRGLLLRTNPLLALPASPDACDLVVGEHAHMAANGNVH